MKIYPPSIFESLTPLRVPIIMYPFEGIEYLFKSRSDLESRVASLVPTQAPLDTKFIIAMPWLTSIGKISGVPNERLAIDYHCYHDFGNKNWDESNPTRTSIPVVNGRPLYDEGIL